MRKYRNKPCVIDGIRFDSKAEARRYQELELLQRGRQIRDLKRQVTFALYGKNGAAICRYRADFMYEEAGKHVVEDVKGVATDDIERRLLLGLLDPFDEAGLEIVSWGTFGKPFEP
jgi:hypothetical protein